MADTKMQLADWLDDLCVRFINNLPQEELISAERICFQLEEAQWFYEDFVRPLDPHLPSMNLRTFCLRMMNHCPLFLQTDPKAHERAYDEFMAYKTRVPVRGAIMLNEAMDHAVLVKGWKKGAKWSFPRGKINKEEKDLDCAVREVYEETGFNIKAAGLVTETSEQDFIEVDMREQNMKLFVFRGIPMDTVFEPKTRKEISDIQWYKLSNLPTAKRKNQQQHQNNQPDGDDTILKDSKFYMVAPFLGKLKQMIKRKRAMDRHKAAMEAQAGTGAGTELEETELEEDTGVGELTADDAPQPAEDNLQQLLAGLGRGQRGSDNLPEVSVQPEQTFDPAAELKRLLSVGGGPLKVEAPSAPGQPNGNPLLAMLQGNNRPPPPITPFEQIAAPPSQPRSPTHHHPLHRPFPNMPPPPFPYAHQTPPHRHPSIPGQMPPPNGYQPHLNRFQPPQPSPTAPQHAMSTRSHVPGLQQRFSQQAPRPYQQTGDPQFARMWQYTRHGSRAPPASNLPPPKLTAHSLSLLETFKSSQRPTPPPNVQQPPRQELISGPLEVSGLQRAHEPFSAAQTEGPQSPQTAIMGPSPSTLTAAPKPRSAHQESLLNLFRSPSLAPATPPPPPPNQNLAPDPVELAAHPSPGAVMKEHPAQPAQKPALDASKLSLLEIFQQPRKPSLTSATVSGPLNAPDFATVQKSAKATSINGHSSRGVSPANSTAVNSSMTPISILTRQTSVPRKESPAAVSPALKTAGPISPKTTVPPPNTKVPFQPQQILRRPPQPTKSPLAAAGDAIISPPPAIPSSVALPSKSPRPTVPAQTPFDRRDSLPQDQKNALLSLFGKAAPRANTPKISTSGVISPVSPLLKDLSAGTAGSPAGRSRISSLGEGGIGGEGLEVVRGDEKGKGPVTPVDRNFLLGFLKEVK